MDFQVHIPDFVIHIAFYVFLILVGIVIGVAAVWYFLGNIVDSINANLRR